MAEIVSEVEEQKRLQDRTETTTEWSDSRCFEVDGRLFIVSEEEITPETARDLAQSSGLVIWDSCGCGGGCGYEIWEGTEVSALIKAGVPRVKQGYVWQIQDDHGHSGVFLEQSVRWGPLR